MMEVALFFLIWWAWNTEIRGWFVETYARAVEESERRKMAIYDEHLDDACCDGCASACEDCGADCLAECDACDGVHGCEGCYEMEAFDEPASEEPYRGRQRFPKP